MGGVSAAGTGSDIRVGHTEKNTHTLSAGEETMSLPSFSLNGLV